MTTKKLPLAYFPLESYQSRYTGLMSCEGGWMEQVFGNRFALESVRPEQDTVVIRSGEVLDSVQRPVYAMRQVIEYLTTTAGSVPVYVDDFFHPGIETLAYAKRKNPPLLYTYCWAQTFDRYDFTRDMPWMRAWEIMAVQHYAKIFVASPILEDLILTALPSLEGKVHNVGLPFNSGDVLRVREQSKMTYPEYHVIYTSRMDSEKNFGFFCDIVEQLGGQFKFAVSTGHDEMRGTDTQGILHAKELVEKGKLVVYTNMTKPDYYALLSRSKIQFNCAQQDWVSFTLLEALTCGCIPVYPMFRDFANVFSDSPEFLYSHLNLPSACDRIRQAVADANKLYTGWAGAFAREQLEYYNGSIDRMAAIMQDDISANLYGP
jgi:hypothetical protein